MLFAKFRNIREIKMVSKMLKELIVRTIWVAKCPKCGNRIEKVESPPRERFCNECKQWVPYLEYSYTGHYNKRG